MALKHRERVIAALNHEQPDRCPMQVSFTPEFAQRLYKEIGLERLAAHNPHGGGNTYQLETYLYLGQDLLLTWGGRANCYYQDQNRYTDEWGIGWESVNYETKFGNGKYTERTGHPLAVDKSIDDYMPPDPNRPELYNEAESLIADYKQEYFIVGATTSTIFETAWALRGLEQLLMDFVLNPELADRILDIPYKYRLAAAKKLTQMGVDMIWLGDDVGTQTGMLISPELWRHFLKPRMKEMIHILKEINPELKIAYHSDGNIYDIIPELIEIGIDVLNPVQPACMDPAKIKRDFGNKLCFWGTVDEQHTLPFGTVEDVRNEVLERIRTVGKNGGLILGPTHHVQLDTPMENFREMVKSIVGNTFF